MHWFTQAAQLGDDAAQFNLGLAYAEGSGVEKNWELAAKWWQRAAAQDNKDATYALEELRQLMAEEQ